MILLSYLGFEFYFLKRIVIVNKLSVFSLLLIFSFYGNATEYLIRHQASGISRNKIDLPIIDTSGLSSCKDIIAKYPNSPSGIYDVNINNSISKVSCDMEVDGGGWMLVLNYLHRGGTNPVLRVLDDRLPVLSSFELGADESNNSNSWGHSSNALFSSLNAKELRFNCYSSETTRVVDFKTSSPSAISYFSTGKGGVTMPMTNVRLPGDTSNLIKPSSIYKDEKNYAMTTFPFFITGKYHWSIRGSDRRWECDTYGGGYDYSTKHSIWVR